jgi:hypothetical protein
MTARKDPVVTDIAQWINRSAGQHQRRISEGTQSARRLLDLKVVDTMTDGRPTLHRVDTSQLAHDDGVSVGGCCNHDCDEGRKCPNRIEFAGPEPYSLNSLLVAVLIVAALCLLVLSLSPELRGLLSLITY